MKASGRSGCYRLTAVFLGLLCVLLLTAITLLLIKFTAERDQLHTSYTNLTAERDQLHTSYTNLTAERDQLQTTCTALTAERDQLQREREECKELVLKMQGWLVYGTSLYYISTEKKRWRESREACRERGGDLLIISSKEEENFVKTLMRCTTVWIGQAAAGKKDGSWKGAGSTALTAGDWWKGHPKGSRGRACVVIDGGNTWKAASFHKYYYWICKKNIPDWCF
ncbi:C-type lectin domain family 17, member A-like isoform X2 [Salminus brasiliensis]|uniref:C-type lectin domain family 17, member A-like isoform X2 n=1 Tax=Salminus brasiliensis TaxID=930266 RepID=UPI003B830094